MEWSGKAEQIITTFRQFDTNADGVISRQELARLLKMLDPRWDDDDIEVLLQAADTNGNSRIEYAEFVNWICGKTADADLSQRGFLEKVGAWMAPEEGSPSAAAGLLTDLPGPDGALPDDSSHVALYLQDFVFRGRSGTGEAPAGADRGAALRWLNAALDSIGRGDKRYKQPVKWLIANCRLWPDCCDSAEPGFVELQQLALDRLDAIGIGYEQDVFAARGLGEALGGMGTGLARPVGCDTDHPRQDSFLRPPPSGSPMSAEESGGSLTRLSESLSYLALLLSAVHAIDPIFQAAARGVCEEASCGGRHHSASPKGMMRMIAKLISDHLESDSPKTADNVDTNRCAWTFDEPSQVREAFQAAIAVFGEPLRVKNSYSPDFDAMAASRGYRDILVNYRFAPEGLTWAALSQEPRTVSSWDTLRETTVKQLMRLGECDDAAAVKNAELLRCFDFAREYLASEEMASEPVVLAVEVQYMLAPYLEMRRRTHFWYKIARAGAADAVAQDFGG